MSWSDDNAELIEGFVAESREALDSINPLFIEVVEDLKDGRVADLETLNGIFRLFHTMKGSAGFLNLNVLVEVNHEAETLLDLCRKDPSLLKSEYIETLLNSCDVLSQLIDAIEANGHDEGHLDTSNTLSDLKAAQENMNNPDGAPSPGASKEVSISGNELTGDEFTLDFALLSPEILEKFVQEGLDLLDTAEGDLLSFEKNKEDSSVLDSAFRNIHTFKGNCGFMSFSDMQKIAHGIEAVLEGLRDGRSKADEETLNVILNSVDTLREGLIGLMQGRQGEIDEKDILLPLLDNLKPSENALNSHSENSSPKTT